MTISPVLNVVQGFFLFSATEHTENAELNISYLLIYPLTHILIIRRFAQSYADKIKTENNFY